MFVESLESSSENHNVSINVDLDVYSNLPGFEIATGDNRQFHDLASNF